ncbi:Putative endoglucanase type K [Rhizoctonia solani]|uniref:cellulase n=1 Tax=Rhizoctonia solani TaxID=456999 RepID=A0A0K6FZ26_9AGAM|nr:Putative endoglucanase type K [Rhizoctonia solani]
MIFSVFIVLITLGAACAQSQSGRTTLYWDCCKESCAWPGKANVSAPVQSCDISNNPLSNNNVQSGCGTGGAYACANHSPFAVNETLAYGFAAVKLQNSSEALWCCQCYELTFTSSTVRGQKMIVQATNTGDYSDNNHFDLMVPGGGVGDFVKGCATQYNASLTGWGARYGGVSKASECSQLPPALQAGCRWRFTWFKSASIPTVSTLPYLIANHGFMPPTGRL